VSKSDYIPAADHDFMVWLTHFTEAVSQNPAECGLTEADIALIQSNAANFRDKVAHASEAAAIAKQATADKNDGRDAAESCIRAAVRRIKGRAEYTSGQGVHLGIEGPENTYDLGNAKPTLTGVDQTGGRVLLSFTKMKSDGINIYCQREGDADWVLLGRATVSPFADNRPLLAIGKPELRRFCGVYMRKDTEIGQFSDEIAITCAP